PVLDGQICCGFRMDLWPNMPLEGPGLHLPLIQEFWKAYQQHQPHHHRENEESRFFKPFFDLLAGGPNLRMQLQSQTPIRKIRRSWQKDLNHFLNSRKAYLLYP
ncbi:MAG: hypothetical protein ACO31H_07910, partial [Bacteroidia bacterium]